MAATGTGKPPDILLVVFDQMSAQSLPCYGHAVVKAPHLQALADRGVVFENAYCNSPLCSPSRFAMMTGQLASRIGAYDNAAELNASVPTFAHYLRALGYRTCLSGKMDFTGADQLHGYEERLTTDLSPSDFGWTPEWERPEKLQPWFHDLASVVDAGPYDHSLAMAYDEEAAGQAVRWLYEAAGGTDERPFLLTVSFMHPHDPYLARREYWDLYDDDAIDLPRVPSIPPAARDPHSRRLHAMYDRDEYAITDERIRRARRGYYGMISYIDAQLGRILAALEALGRRDDTVIIATADHGDMLGERGLWYKMTFFERAVRVPLILCAPALFAARRVAPSVALVDLLPTLLSIAGSGARDAMPAPIDGTSLMPLASGGTGGPEAAYGEYMAEGTSQPIFMIRRGAHKYIACAGDPPQLFDLAADPLELNNLAGRAEQATLAAVFAAEAARKWDSAAIRRQVIDSQRRRALIHGALLQGRVQPWDYAPAVDASRQYYRNLTGAEFTSDRPSRVPSRPPPTREGRTKGG
ncbi:MAG TPA: choline-sulfatase [Candidatus Angelobacter sp.]|nr:choline-sulfatase [Candidatus Angelobacter sp.]